MRRSIAGRISSGGSVSVCLKSGPAYLHDDVDDVSAARPRVAQPPFRQGMQPFLQKLAGGLILPAPSGRKIGFQQSRDRRGGSLLHVARQFGGDWISLRNDQEDFRGVGLCLDECKK